MNKKETVRGILGYRGRDSDREVEYRHMAPDGAQYFRMSQHGDTTYHIGAIDVTGNRVPMSEDYYCYEVKRYGNSKHRMPVPRIMGLFLVFCDRDYVVTHFPPGHKEEDVFRLQAFRQQSCIEATGARFERVKL